MEQEKIHIWEKAGLGKAPFVWVGCDTRHYCPAPGVVMVGYACQYCYTRIVECHHIRSSDGKEFIVGNECVKKTFDKGLISSAAKAHNAEVRKAAQARDDAKIAELRALLDDPNNFEALEGKQYGNYSLLASARWHLVNAGRAGKVRLWKIVKEALGGAK